MSLLKQSILKRILRDVTRGFSVSNYLEKRIYVKHIGLIDQIDIDDYREEHYERAKKRGIPTMEETLEILFENGDWTKEEEKEIETKTKFIDQLIENKSGMYLQSQLDNQDKLIEEERKVLTEKMTVRQALLGNTCEEAVKPPAP